MVSPVLLSPFSFGGNHRRRIASSKRRDFKAQALDLGAARGMAEPLSKVLIGNGPQESYFGRCPTTPESGAVSVAMVCQWTRSVERWISQVWFGTSISVSDRERSALPDGGEIVMSGPDATCRNW